MGFFDSVSSFFSDPVGSISEAAGGVGDLFSDNPLGGMLSAFSDAGGGGGILDGLSDALEGFGDFSKMLNSFSSLAEQFMGDDSSLLSKLGITAVKIFTNQAEDSGDVATFAKKMGEVRDRLTTSQEIKEIADSNLAQIYAQQQAKVAGAQYLA